MKPVYQFLKKYGLLVSLLVGVLFIVGALMPTFSLPSTANMKELYKNHNGAFEFSILSMYILTFLGAGLAAIFGVRGLALNFKKSYKVLILAAGILVVYFATGAMGDGSMGLDLQKKFPTMQTPTVQMVDGSILMLYVMIFLGVAAALFSSVKGLFSK